MYIKDTKKQEREVIKLLPENLEIGRLFSTFSQNIDGKHRGSKDKPRFQNFQQF
jgi:hypothetical protein